MLKASLIAVLYGAWMVAGLLPAEHVHRLPFNNSSIVHRHLAPHHEHGKSGHAAQEPDDDHDHVLTLDALLARRATVLDIQLPPLAPQLVTYDARLRWVGDVSPDAPPPTASPPPPRIAPRAPPA